MKPHHQHQQQIQDIMHFMEQQHSSILHPPTPLGQRGTCLKPQLNRNQPSHTPITFNTTQPDTKPMAP